tara:strand:- start:42 stop:1256 length:1215 start_codon:yes stop_codon:yes gene_type:complete
MAGGLMQLVAYGAQDVYLTGNPKVTFFQAVYKRHTNFAMENIEQTVNGTPGSDGRVSVTVARNGDLVADMYVEMKAGTAAATDDAWIAERAVKDVELSIGGQRIDKHYQKWWRLYSELYLDEAKKANYGKMTTSALEDGKIFLPLIFFFNRNPGLALPLIALQYHEVRLDFDLSSAFGTVTDGSTFKVWANYVYLDTEERRRFAQKGHEYLIEQVQHTGTDTVTAGSEVQKRLSYNHPVKELVWCLDNGDDSWRTANAHADVTSNILSVTAESNCLVSSSLVGAPLVAFKGANFSEENNGTLDTFKLVLNGQDRFKEQSGKYFNTVQPFVHHSGSPAPGVYAYSFALKPEEHQPTGTCNFSRIDNAQVAIKAKTGIAETTLRMFATNYNVLRIQSGMGGLAFSN